MGEIVTIVVAIILMVFLLIKEYLRPGVILFSMVIVLLAAGILSPTDALTGFSNKGMITVALLFLVSEGIRCSQCLSPIMRRLFPSHAGCSVTRGYLSIVPTVAFISAFLNNTPIVVIFIPHIKMWCRRVGLGVKKFLIPLSYAAILGGMCTLIGTSTNLVVHGLMLDAGLEGFTMFELGKVGAIIAVVGVGYMVLFIRHLLPDDTHREIQSHNRHIVEVILSPRFPGIGCTTEQFSFHEHYGSEIISVRRDGELIDELEGYSYKENDTLLLSAHRNFVDIWGSSRIFIITTNGTEHNHPSPRWKRWLSLLLLIVMILGASLSEQPFMRHIFGDICPDMFFWAAVVAIIMAFCNIFPAKSYTKFISWDILITIASALAISRAMTLSGLADIATSAILSASHTLSPRTALALIYIITNIITELITNNAAAAFAFPIAISAATKLSVSPMPFCVAIAIAASASFCTPIGYQTNTIVQGLAGYSFKDFIRSGLPLTVITFVISIIFIPIFWSF